MDFAEGQKLIKQKQFGKALEFFLKKEKEKIKNHKIFFSLGLIYFELNNFNKSNHYYDKFLKIEPKSTAALLNLAILKQTMGELKIAREIYIKLIRENKSNVRAYYGIYTLNPNLLTKSFYINLNQLYKSKKFNYFEKGIIEFLLSKNEKKNKKFEKELEYLKNSHLNIFKSNFSYNQSSQFYYNKVIKHHYNKIKIVKNEQQGKNIKTNDIEPIYIIGLPRSGSTLIESILTSGTDKLTSFGESNIVNVSVLDQVAPNIYSGVFDDKNFDFKLDYKILKENILNRYSQYSSIENIRFIDKSLENFFNIEAIIQVFPKAKFLHTYRSSKDSVLSIYQSMLADLSWTHSIDDILNYIDCYLKVINYYKLKYPDNIFDVNLENLTHNSEEVTKKIFEFCNIKWSINVLNFYKRRDLFSKTLSLSQVRSKVSKYNQKKYQPYFYLLDNFKNKYKWL